MEPYRYIIWLGISWIPIIILWAKFFGTLKRYIKIVLYLNIMTFVPGVMWDYIAITNGIWYFVEPLAGPLVFDYFLVEELILIFSMPWFILTTTVLFGKLFKKNARIGGRARDNAPIFFLALIVMELLLWLMFRLISLPPHFFYIALLIPIFLPGLLVLLFFSNIIYRNKKAIIATVIFFSMVWYFIVDILAVRMWRIWFYDTDKILNIWILGTALEEFLWIIAMTFLFSSGTVVLAEQKLYHNNNE